MANVNPIQVQKYLDGVNYPISRNDLIDAARKEGAGEDVIAALQAMPDKEYHSPVDVSEAIGKTE